MAWLPHRADWAAPSYRTVFTIGYGDLHHRTGRSSRLGTAVCTIVQSGLHEWVRRAAPSYRAVFTIGYGHLHRCAGRSSRLGTPYFTIVQTMLHRWAARPDSFSSIAWSIQIPRPPNGVPASAR